MKKYVVREGCQVMHNGKVYKAGDEIICDDLNEGVLNSVDEIEVEDIDPNQERFDALMKQTKEQLLTSAGEAGIEVKQTDTKEIIAKAIIAGKSE